MVERVDIAKTEMFLDKGIVNVRVFILPEIYDKYKKKIEEGQLVMDVFVENKE